VSSLDKYNSERKDISARTYKYIGVAFLIFSISLVILLYWRWTLPGIITWGDWLSVANSALSDFSLVIWNAGGLGNYIIQGIPLLPIVTFQGFLHRIFLYDCATIQRLLIFYPLILLLIISPWYLAHTLGYRKIGIATTIIVFNLNSIIFLVTPVTTFALAISLSPLVIATFMQTIQRLRVRECLLFGLIFSLQMVFEIRLAYVTIAFCFLYLIYYQIISSKKNQCNFLRCGKILFLIALVVALLHSYWLIPFLLGMVSGESFIVLPSGYNSASWVRTLSYWNLLHVLGLQSPWWGRPYTVNPPNPQFLLLPILAFSVFLFPKYKRNQILLFFGLAALVFSFLAKGSKPPFGEIYIWLFLHFPGFSMFREPGKWWFPVVISYSVLIGGLADYLVTTENINKLSSRLKKHFSISLNLVKISLFFLAVVVFFIIFPVHPISILPYAKSGIWNPRTIPEEANYFESFFHAQPNFFRIVWLPQMYRFGHVSSQHPALSAVQLGQDMLSSLRSGNPEDYSYTFSFLGKAFHPGVLRLLSIKYIVVPFAPQDEPFIYYWFETSPEYYHHLAEKTPGIIPVDFKGKSKVYELPNFLPHFYSSSKSRLILGNYDDILPIAAKGGYLKDKPVLLITEQNLLLKDSMLSSKNFVLQDRNIEDFAVEFAKSVKIAFSVSNNKDIRRLKAKINKAGTYELWIDYSKIKFKDGVSIPIKIRIDRKVAYDYGEDLNLNKEQDGLKYLKLAELDLKAGQHNIEIQIDDERIKFSVSSVILVDKFDRLKLKSLILNKAKDSQVGFSYIFSQDADFRVE
jgi:hypothetical protein